jgi:hypothetical protein
MAYLMLSAMLFMLNFSPQEVAHREILLVAQRIDDPDLLIQKKILQADEEGLAERDIIITLITPESDKKRFEKLMKNGKGLRFILIGKDGGIKLSSDKPVTLEQLFALIDSMPMRRYEVKIKTSPSKGQQ